MSDPRELALFEAVVELSPPERSRYLRDCGADAALVASVRELLAFHDSGASRVDALLAPRPGRRALPAPGATLLGRYRLAERLGRGGFGSVHRATDTLAGRDVAIKFLDGVPAGWTQRVRDEIAWLRVLALRGVPRVLDEGDAAGCPWFAMEIVDGAAFPGCATPLAWARLEPLFVALLDALAGVHAAGLVHLDLKPANVSVDAHGRVTLLDFGISARARSDEWPERRAGTPPYAAPEQLDGTAAPGPPADLHAVGVMLHEALGVAPGHALPDDVPVRVGRLLARLVDADPARRPPSCHHVLEHVAGRRFVPTREVDWTSVDGLRALFAGHDRVLHEPEDAARHLHRIAGGDARRGQATVQAWLRTGVAVPRGERLLVDRPALDELAAIARLGDGRGDASTLEARADAFDASGQLDRALALRGEVLRARAGDVARRRDASRALVVTALRAQSVTASDEARRALASAGCVDADVPGAVSLLEFAARANHGDGRRALDELERLGVVPEPELEHWRQTVMMRAAMSCGLDEMRRISTAARAARVPGDDAVRRARHALWDGLIAYHEGDFAASARHHERAAALGVRRVDRLRARLNAANAWLEALDLARAEEHARSAACEAAACRFAQLEARALLIERSAAWRACRPLEPDVELADAVARLGSTAIEAQVLRTEAGFAWRAGRRAVGRALAERSAAAWGALGNPLGVAVSRGLGAVCGAGWTPEALDHARAQVEEARLPRVALQLAALIVESGAPPMELPAVAGALAPPSAPALRWEIYSWDELVARLDGSPGKT